MIQIGYSLVEISTGSIVQSFGALPARANVSGTVCDFDKVGQIMPDAAAPTHKLVARMANDPPEGQYNITSEAAAFDGEQVIVTRVYESLPEPVRQIEKATVMARLTDEQLEQAISLMSVRQQERWRMPGYPNVNVDDPDLLAVLAAIGADAEEVLAP
jgi:hypothetical protein